MVIKSKYFTENRWLDTFQHISKEAKLAMYVCVHI